MENYYRRKFSPANDNAMPPRKAFKVAACTIPVLAAGAITGIDFTLTQQIYPNIQPVVTNLPVIGPIMPEKLGSQGWGGIAAGLAYFLSKVPKTSMARSQNALVSAGSIPQYVLTGAWAGVAQVVTNAVRGIALTYIADDDRKTRRNAAMALGAAGTGLVTYGAAVSSASLPMLMFNMIPVISVTLGAVADVMPDTKSHLNRGLRMIIHPSNMLFDFADLKNVMSIMTNVILTKNFWKNIREQRDFPPAVNDNGEKQGLGKRWRAYLGSMKDEKTPKLIP